MRDFILSTCAAVLLYLALTLTHWTTDVNAMVAAVVLWSVLIVTNPSRW